MAKVIIAGNVAVVESKYTIAEIEKIERFCPNALTLTDEKEDIVFRVGLTTGRGSMSTYGIGFCKEIADKNRKASVTVEIPVCTLDVTEYVQDTLGLALVKFKLVEEQWESALATCDLQIQAIRNSITVV